MFHFWNAFPYRRVIVFTFICIAVIGFMSPRSSYAQSLFDDFSLGVAKYYLISEKVEAGDIIAVEGSVYAKTKKVADVAAVGVVVAKPAVEINDTAFSPDEQRYPLISDGRTLVKATTKNGNIKKGDVLTTSDIPGVAMKLTQPGFAIGVAEENLDNHPDGSDLIAVMLHFQYSYGQEGGKDQTAAGFNNFAVLAKLLDYRSPSAVLKYIFAAIVVIIAIVFGYFSFARIAARGVEAIGRNPLASKSIHLSVLLNVFVTLGIILAGLVLAFFIITL